MLDLCQVGDYAYVYDNLFHLAHVSSPLIIQEFSPNPLTPEILENHLINISQSISCRSILGMFLRTTPENAVNPETKAIAQAGFEKEFLASQSTFRDSPAFDWSPFYTDEIPRGCSDPDWYYLLRRMILTFRAKINRLPILYPTVNRQKNTSEETSWIAQQYGGPEYCRTVDLEVLYSQTGFKVQGPCEMRSAYKFNVLKPRFYYCKGGKSHHKAKYMKPLAVALLECLLTTSRYRRQDPVSYLPVSDDTFIVYWDFISFTTCLSELKFFMDAISRGIRDETYPVRVFDYKDGLIEVSAADLFDDYNEHINHFDEFAIHRITQALNLDLDTSSTKLQHNSGMLGVEGNIGFSMSVHGTVIAGELGDEYSFCVGDDGIGSTFEEPSTSLIPTLQSLGSISVEKFGIVRPQKPEYAKFLKRGFLRADGHIYRTILLNFPISAFIDEQYAGRTLPPNLTDKSRLERVVGQIGQLLWEVFKAGDEITDYDIAILYRCLKKIYFELGFPMDGTLSAFRVSKRIPSPVIVKKALPSILFDKFDPRYGDWLEYLMDNHVGPINIPMFGITPVQPIKPSEGESIYVDSRNPGFKALEDMGYVKVDDLSEDIYLNSEDSRRKIRRMIGRIRDKDLRRFSLMTCVREIPSRYDFLFQAIHLSWDYMEVVKDI